MNYSQICLPALTVKQEQHNTQRAQEVSRLFGCPRYQEHYGEILIHDAITFPVTGIVFVTGTSGSGKTSLLNTVFKTIPNTQMLEEFSNIEVSLVDAFCDEFKWSVAQCLRWLGCFGLAEVRVYLTSFRYLSEGQKYRARLARLLAKNPSCVVIDEFLSVLDRQTARVVAFQFQKLCRMHGIAAIIASSHNDLIEPLGVDSLVLIHLNRKIDIKHFKDKKLSPCLSELNSLAVQEGTWDDYNALGPVQK